METRCIAVCVALSICAAAASAQLSVTDKPQTPALRLVPTPRDVKMGDGRFKLSAGMNLRADADDQFAAQQIVDEAKTDLDVSLSVGANKPAILLRRGTAGLSAPAQGEGYVLSVTKGGVTIEAPTSAGIFYGVQTLKQLIRANSNDEGIPACTITDWPQLKYRAWQDDISRGPIPTLDYLKREVRTMAEYKENAFTLYTEHVFNLHKHPSIAPDDGITAEEIKELVEYARPYHIDVWGNYQSFGHQAHLFSLPQYADMGDHGWAFDPAREKTYQFLADVYSEIAPAYPSDFFVISCDEVGGFVNPDAVEMIKKLGPGGFYAYHIDRVDKLLKPYRKTAMMWGDIALEHPEEIPKLPKDIIVLPWTYGDNGNFDKWVKPYDNDGYRTIVCPGVNCWNRVWPAVDEAVANISDFTRDGMKYHTLGQLNTMWRDDGETLFGYCYYPLLWGAETAWSPVPPESGKDSHKQRDERRAAFDAAFDGVFYGMTGDAIAKANQTLGHDMEKNSLTKGLSDGAFWTDPVEAWAGLSSSHAANDLANQSTDLLKTVSAAREKAKYNADTLDELSLALRRVRYEAQRVVMVDELVTGVQKENADEPRKKLRDELSAIRAQYVRLWKSENRAWWLDHNTVKYDGLLKTLDTLPTRVAISPARTEFSGSVSVQLAALSNSAVRYTQDGSDPTHDSPVYSAPIDLIQTATIKARQFPPTGQPGPVVAATYYALRLPARVVTRMQPKDGHVAAFAFDGDDRTYFWSSAPPRVNWSVGVELDQAGSFHHVAVKTGRPEDGKDTLRHGVIETSADGKDWKKVAEFKDGVAEADLSPEPIKWVRAKVTDGQDTPLAVREIDLK